MDEGVVESKGRDVLDGRAGYPALVPFNGGEVFEGPVLAVVQGFDLICLGALPDRRVVDLCPCFLRLIIIHITKRRAGC